MKVDVHDTRDGGDPKHVKVDDADCIQEALVDVRELHVCHGSKLKREHGNGGSLDILRNVTF